jgi:cyclopropane fatty-acyl-phospholipid synthase-like methyltransferase
LPYFAKEFGFNVFGLDYSEIGCDYTAEILRRENVKGSVICADFNSPPESLLNRFDVVFSNGVVEHFFNTEQCLKTFSRFLKKDGLIITIVPNFKSIYGFLQKTLNKPVYDIHVVLDIDDLNTSHQQAGLGIVDSRYFLSNDFSLINLNGIQSNDWRFKSKKVFLGSLNLLSTILWFLETYSYNFTISKSLSPYIICTAKKIA